jgi:hypothetical protein
MRRTHVPLSAFLALALASGCSTAPEPEGPRIETAADFVTALRQAGIEVEETPAQAPSFDLPGSKVLRLATEAVEVYESASETEQRAAVQDLLRTLPADSPPNVWGRGRIIVVYDGLDGPTIALLSGILGDSLNLAGPVQDEPYPPAVVAAIGWLAEQWGTDPGAVVVEDFEDSSWPDACLGLAQTGEACAGVVTPGWRVTMRLGDTNVVLRTDALGSQIRQER